MLFIFSASILICSVSVLALPSPRAGHHADVIVAEDIAHVKTPMGLIGIKIRIARKEKLVPEFEFKQKKQEKIKQDAAPTIKDEDAGKTSEETVDEGKAKTETVDEGKAKTETVDEGKAKTETEQIRIDAEKMKSIETMEEEENKLKK